MNDEKRTLSPKLQVARDQQAAVFTEAWRIAKEAKHVRPTSEDIRDARIKLGVPPLGARDHFELETLVGTTTKGFRIDSGTSVVQLHFDGVCENGHHWKPGSTVYKRHQKPMCPICGDVIT